MPTHYFVSPAAPPSEPLRGTVPSGGPGLLCVANFPARTGYAWDFIEGLYGALAEHFGGQGVTTWVAYPPGVGGLEATSSRAFVGVDLDMQFRSWRSVRRVLEFVRRNRIAVVYLSDRSAWHVAYIALRLAGVRWIVLHDHTSGERTKPRGAKRVLKRLRALVRSGLTDRVVAVSDFVAARKIEVDLVPTERVRRIWNARPVVERDSAAGDRLRAALGLGRGMIVACACRSTPEKGVAHLLRAFDRYCTSLGADTAKPTLVYFGDGPALPELRKQHAELAAAGNIILTGYRADATELIAGADVCVVPSLWQEAFGLAALEPMTYGIPVIASRVGGIPEVVVDGETGVLVEPGDEAGLERALGLLLSQPAERARLGRNGLVRARTYFSWDAAVKELVAVIEPGFEGARGAG